MSEPLWKAIPNDLRYHYDFTFDYEDGRVAHNYNYFGTHRLVPAEPCVHGNYARHIDPDYDYFEKHLDDYEWCEGEPA